MRNDSIIVKIIAVFLCMVMVMGASGMNAYAASIPTEKKLSDESVIVVETNGVRTVSVNDGAITYVVEYDTINETICVSQVDNVTKITTYGTVESTSTPSVMLSPASIQSTIHQDTFCNYEYDIYTGNPNEWNLERPQETGSGQYYFRVYENSSNTNQLDKWFDAVNTLNDKEWQVVTSYGVALVTSAAAGFISGMAVASGGILTPGAITAIVAATGATGTAVTLLTQVGTQCNVCLRAYWNVYNATNNIHY